MPKLLHWLGGNSKPVNGHYPPSRSTRKPRPWLLAGLAALWLLGVSYGVVVLLNYSFAPASPANAAPRWPEDSSVRKDSSFYTLVMVAHPQCPCTRASIGELEILMARFQDRLRARVLFVQPEGMTEDWVKASLWDQAANIPGVTAAADRNGVETRRFGGVASGQTFFYDPQGRLLFSGGITAARGHSGDNAGRAAIASLLTQGTADRTTNVSFGCYLF
jgi:hypothetical protein